MFDDRVIMEFTFHAVLTHFKHACLLLSYSALLRSSLPLWQEDILNICDPTRVNEADVVLWPKCDFAVIIFYVKLRSFWHQNCDFIIFHSRVMRKSKLLSCNIRNLEVQVWCPETFHFVNKSLRLHIKLTV